MVLGLVQQDEVVNTGQQGNNGDGNTGRVQVAMLEGGQGGNNVDGDPGRTAGAFLCIKVAAHISFKCWPRVFKLLPSRYTLGP